MQMDEKLLSKAVLAASAPVHEVAPASCQFCNSWEASLKKERLSRDGTGMDIEMTVPLDSFCRHIKHHMEQLALFAIPPGADDDESESASMRTDQNVVGSLGQLSEPQDLLIDHGWRADELPLMAPPRFTPLDTARDSLTLPMIKRSSISSLSSNDQSPLQVDDQERRVHFEKRDPRTSRLQSRSTPTPVMSMVNSGRYEEYDEYDPPMQDASRPVVQSPEAGQDKDDRPGTGRRLLSRLTPNFLKRRDRSVEKASNPFERV